MKDRLKCLKVNGSPLIYFFVSSAALFVLWISFSGMMETKFLLLGVVFSVFTAYVCMPCLMLKNEKTGREYFLLKLNYLRFAVFFVWLMFEILRTGLIVTRIIFDSRKRCMCKSYVRCFRLKCENPAVNAFLAISMTLLPGIITLDVSDDGIFEIHVLCEELEKFIFSGRLQRMVADIFGEKSEFEPMQQDIKYMPKEL